jgi:hypothetical protein
MTTTYVHADHEGIPAPGTLTDADGRPVPAGMAGHRYPVTGTCRTCQGRICCADGTADWGHLTTPTAFVSLAAFYEADPARARSGEADYGVHWQAGGQDWPRYRVSYVQATGEIYAVCQRGPCPVRILGVIPPDQPPGPGAAGSSAWHHANRYYRTLDVILDGWADPDISGHDLGWIERKLAGQADRLPMLRVAKAQS